jgi:hypothetical protein
MKRKKVKEKKHRAEMKSSIVKEKEGRMKNEKQERKRKER